MRSSSSLNLSHRARGSHAFRAFDRRQSGDAKIVSRGPQPEAVGLAGITLDGELNLRPSGRTHIARRVLLGTGNRDVISGQRLRQIAELHRLLHFDEEAERVSVKGRSL